MFTPYEEKFKRKPDFRVTYNIFSQEEGGRHMPTFQGIRWDFYYDHPENPKSVLSMIWPEFEDKEGNVITASDLMIPKYGIARMWIMSEDMIDFHREKIKVGTHGFFMEGGRKVGECDVIELINLK